MPQRIEQFGPFHTDEIFAQIPSVLLLTDADGVVLDWNDRAAALLDGVLEKGKALHDLMANAMERKRVQKQAREVMQGKQDMLPRLRVTLRCVDDTERPFSVGIYVLKKPRQPMALLWQLEPAAPQANYQALFDSVTEGIAVFDATGRLHDVNTAFADLVGYTREELLDPQVGWARITPPEYLAQDMAFIKQALKGDAVRYQKEYLHKDGQRIPIQIAYRRLGQQDGWEQELLIATVSHAGAMLTEGLHAAMDASSNVLMLASPGFTITHVNKACLDFFAQKEHLIAQDIPGFSAARLVGSSIDAFHKKAPRVRRILQHLVGQTHGEEAVHHGRIELAGYTFLLTARPVVIAGQFMGYSVEWHDVTAEQAHEARWQALLDGSEQGIMVLDSAAAVLEANAAARNMLGTQPDWQAILGKARPQLFNALEKAMGKGSGQFETWAVAQDKHAVYLRCHLKRLPQGPDDLRSHFVMTITDLTDLKEKEQAIAEQEAYWREIIHSATEGIVVMGTDTSLYEVNPAYAAMHGYTVDEIRRPGWNWLEALVPDAAERTKAMKHVQHALETGEPVSYEMHQQRKDGTPIDLRVAARKLLRRPEWAQDRLVVVLSDITELKAKERALEEAARFQQEIFDSITEGLSIFGADGELHEINKALSTLMGYTREELLEDGWLHITPPEYLERDKSYIQRALEGELVRYEKEFIHKDGHRIPAMLSYCKLKRQEGWVHDRLVAVVSDITALKENEKGLAEAMRFQQEVFDSITEGLAVFGIDGELYDINPAFADLVGYDRDEVMRAGWVRITPPELLEQDRQYIQRALQGEVVRYEKGFIHKDGHRIPVMLSYRKLERQEGWQGDRLIATLSDLSALETIKKKEAELADAARYQQELFESLTEGLAVFSLDGKLHEVNTAMTVMTGYTMAEARSPDFGWDRVIHPSQMEQAMTLIMAAMENRAVRTEFEFLRKDGQSIPVMVSFCKLNRHPDWDQDRLVAIISDISILKQQELELRRIQAALDTVSTNVVVADASGIIIYENPANKHFWKEREAKIRAALPHFSAESMLGSNIDVFHRKPEHQRAIMARMAESGLDARTTIQLAGFELDAVVHPIFDKGGLVQGYVAEFVDVTAQREKEAQIQAFMDAAFEGMTVFDADGRLYLANQRCADLLGLGLDTIMSPTFDCRREILRMTPEESQAIMASLQLQEGRVATMEWEIIRRDGSKLPVLLGITKLPWRGTWDKDHYIATIFDLSEIRSREHALKQASRYRQELFESLTEGLIVFSLDGKLHEANKAFAVMMGYSPEEVRSPDFNWSRIVAPEKMDQAVTLITEALQGRSMRIEFEFVRKDGQRIPILISYRKLERHADWDQDRLVAIVSDFTQLKTAITHLQQAAAHIRGHLRKRKKSYAKTQRADVAVGISPRLLWSYCARGNRRSG